MSKNEIFLVIYRYGSEVVKLLENALYVVGNVVMIVYNVDNFGVKVIAKRVVKDIGKEFVKDIYNEWKGVSKFFSMSYFFLND